MRAAHGCPARRPLPGSSSDRYLCCIAQKQLEPVMTTRTSTIAEVFAIIGSAFAAAAAVDGGRRPRSRDLRNLGIDPEQYRAIRGF